MYCKKQTDDKVECWDENMRKMGGECSRDQDDYTCKDANGQPQNDCSTNPICSMVEEGSKVELTCEEFADGCRSEMRCVKTTTNSR